jgi:hypothetical protein
MGGVPINSLQDLLLLREIKNRANMGYSAIKAMADGVALGIEEQRENAKKKKEQEDLFANLGKLSGNTNSNKITTSINEKGQASYRIEPRDKEDVLKIKREQRLTDQYALNNATKLRQEFINRPEVKDYVTVSTNVKAMEGLLKTAVDTNSAENFVAIDQGLITMYNKLTDPASVVRESEYARTPGNLPIVNRIYGAIGKLQQGGAGLTNEDRQALVDGAKIILKERGNQYNSTLNDYVDLSSQYGLDKNMIVRGMEPFEPSNKKIEVYLNTSNPSSDIKAKYNALRGQGISAAEAKKRLGL